MLQRRFYTQDAETLMNTPMEPINFIVDDFIPQGVHVLAGAPKIGKSWLTLWICLQVSKGKPVWNFTAKPCEILYLCLEDGFARIQNRLFKLTDDAPSTLHFATMSAKLGDGLEEQIKNFITDHPDTKLVFIDTLQQIRGDGSGESSYNYAADYQQVNLLKDIADQHKLAIVLIHHLRKAYDKDPLNMISGSTGISGCADSNFVLQKDLRVKNFASFFITGRDFEQRELHLEFNPKTFLWEPLDPLVFEEKIVDPVIVSLCQYIKSVTSFTGTATELVEVMPDCECAASVLKKRAIQHMEYLNRNGITYTDHRTYDRRAFSLHYDSMTDEYRVVDLPSVPS